MNLSLLTPPRLDPTALFEIYRGAHATELLTAAVAHFRVFDRFVGGPMTWDELRTDLGLAERPAAVLLTALRAFGLLEANASGRDRLAGVGLRLRSDGNDDAGCGRV